MMKPEAGRAALDRLMSTLDRAGAVPAPLSEETANFLSGVFAGSSYLFGLAERQPERLSAALNDGPGKEVRANPLGGCRRSSQRQNAARTHEHPASGEKRSRVPDCACRSRRCLDGGGDDPEAQRGRRYVLEPCRSFSFDPRSAARADSSGQTLQLQKNTAA